MLDHLLAVTGTGQLCARGSPQAKNPDDELLQEPVKKKAPPANSEKPAKQAAPTDDAESPPATKSNQSQPATGVMGLIEASGSIGVVIILLSILGMALNIELFMTIRKGKLAPKALVEDLMLRWQLRISLVRRKSAKVGRAICRRSFNRDW